MKLTLLVVCELYAAQRLLFLEPRLRMGKARFGCCGGARGCYTTVHAHGDGRLFLHCGFIAVNAETPPLWGGVSGAAGEPDDYLL
ncbi:hypothetical protein, partial [Paraburkholderia sp. SIMBA_030]|uniref:hypothetical protein n=1 Tax=Paraburkholderia sp. SIMBA_030 TaxID=3085773 RepID=UPI0039799948